LQRKDGGNLKYAIEMQDAHMKEWIADTIANYGVDNALFLAESIIDYGVHYGASTPMPLEELGDVLHQMLDDGLEPGSMQWAKEARTAGEHRVFSGFHVDQDTGEFEIRDEFRNDDPYPRDGKGNILPADAPLENEQQMMNTWFTESYQDALFQNDYEAAEMVAERAARHGVDVVENSSPGLGMGSKNDVPTDSPGGATDG